MTFADLVDLRVDALNRERLGDDYSPGIGPAWLQTMARWFVFRTFVDLMDRAVRDPLALTSALVLLTADALVETSVFELSSALRDAGTAILARPLAALPTVEVVHSDAEDDESTPLVEGTLAIEDEAD